MPVFFFTTFISVTLLVISLLWMYKLLGTNLFLTLPGYFYIHFIVFIFIGSPLIFIKHGAYNYIYIISTHLVLLIFPLGILITNKLMVIDHPDSVDIYVNETFIPPPYPPFRVYSVSNKRLPKVAIDNLGNDLRSGLLLPDEKYIDHLTPSDYQGIMEPHDMILDFGDSNGC